MKYTIGGNLARGKNLLNIGRTRSAAFHFSEMTERRKKRNRLETNSGKKKEKGGRAATPDVAETTLMIGGKLG